MQEDLFTVNLLDKAEAFFLVVKLHFAGGHVHTPSLASSVEKLPDQNSGAEASISWGGD
jgi:hypothetical protein